VTATDSKLAVPVTVLIYISPFVNEDIDYQIARCNREISEMENQEPTKPAFLTTLGIEDWEAEKRILERMKAASNGF